MATHPSYRAAEHKALVRAWLDLFTGTWITAFPEKDKTKSAKTGFQYNPDAFEDQYETLCKWNEAGFNPCFTPNSCIGGRKMENCKAIKAWYCDFDAKNGTPEEHIEKILGAKLKPDFVFQSSPAGHHAYWIARDGSLDNFDKIETGIVQSLGADPNCKDKVRAMRIPFFLHQKTANHFMPKILEGAGYFITGIKPLGYSDEEMQKAYPAEKAKEQIRQEVITARSHQTFWNAAASISNKAALRALSGKPEVNNDVFSFKLNIKGTEQIWVNGESTSSWIDLDGHIGSHDKGGPTYIQWLEWYGNSKAKIALAIKKYLHEYLPAYDEKAMAKSYSFVAWDDLTERAYQYKIALDPNSICKYHLRKLDNILGGILPRELVVVGADTGCGKSDLLLYLALENARRGKKVLYYQLEMDEEEIADRAMLTATNQHLAPGWIGAKQYRINEMDQLQKEAFEKAKEEVKAMGGGKNIDIYQGGSLNTEEFLASLKIMKEKSYDLVILDHLHYFSLSNEFQTLANNLSIVMREIRTVVKAMHVPIIVASHMRKREKENESPSIMDLHGTGDIAKEASVVLLLHRTETETFLTIAKSRGTGHRGEELKLHYDTNLRRFVDDPPANGPQDQTGGPASQFGIFSKT
jgi:ATP:corrinoid adenosyltransferase